MAIPNNHLLCHFLENLLPKLAEDPENSSLWSSAQREFSREEQADEDLQLALEAEDLELLTELVAGYANETRVMPANDRAILKRAMKAFRKRLKVTMLDDASGLGVGPMSGGRGTSIVGVTPPEHYPQEVWDSLVRQKRLVADRWGTYELPPGG
jgi:hypothetical protein